jgi:hypothetical protein
MKIVALKIWVDIIPLHITLGLITNIIQIYFRLNNISYFILIIFIYLKITCRIFAEIKKMHIK